MMALGNISYKYDISSWEKKNPIFRYLLWGDEEREKKKGLFGVALGIILRVKVFRGK